MNRVAIDSLIEDAIAAGVTPGSAYAVGTESEVSAIGRRGRFTYDPHAPLMTDTTLWDLASVTKVVATTAVAMILADRGELDIDAPIAEVVEEFRTGDKSNIRVRNLLLHDSGLPASHPHPTVFTDSGDLLDSILGLGLDYEPETLAVYSDIGFVVLGVLLERLTAMGLGELAESLVWKPLGMTETQYCPPADARARCAPTEAVEAWRRALPDFNNDGPWIQGEVHDPTARVLGGVAAHAGAFSTVADIAKFMQAMLNARFCSVETVERFTKRWSNRSSRALGWDTPEEGSSAGRKLSKRAFGHTGFTGTSVWADPDLGFFAVLLTNRVHPRADNLGIRELRPAFHDAAVEAVRS